MLKRISDSAQAGSAEPSLPQFAACMATLDRLFAYQASVDEAGKDGDDADTLLRVAGQLAGLVEMAEWIHGFADSSDAEMAFRRDLEKSISTVLGAAEEFLEQHA